MPITKKAFTKLYSEPLNEQKIIDFVNDERDDLEEILNETVDKNGYTALTFVATLPNAYLYIESLVAKGADANLADQQGRTPLSLALTTQTVQILDAFVYGAGADPEPTSYKDEFGQETQYTDKEKIEVSPKLRGLTGTSLSLFDEYSSPLGKRKIAETQARLQELATKRKQKKQHTETTQTRDDNSTDSSENNKGYTPT